MLFWPLISLENQRISRKIKAEIKQTRKINRLRRSAVRTGCGLPLEGSMTMRVKRSALLVADNDTSAAIVSAFATMPREDQAALLEHCGRRRHGCGGSICRPPRKWSRSSPSWIRLHGI